MSRPPSRENLPVLPPGATVTAWEAGYSPADLLAAEVSAQTLSRLSPRQVIALLLHVSWLRWHEYSAMVKAQVEESATRGAGARGVIGHRTSASAVTGGLYPTSEEIRALVRLEGQERDRCAKLAMDAHNMGLTLDDW